MFGQRLRDAVLVLGIDVNKKNVLRRGQAQIGLELLHYAAQPALQPVVAGVLDAAVFHEQRPENICRRIAGASRKDRPAG